MQEILGRLERSIQVASEQAGEEHTLSGFTAARDGLNLMFYSLQQLHERIGSMDAKPMNKKKVAESKAIQGLKSLKSGKEEFRIWNDKLINAFSVLFP